MTSKISYIKFVRENIRHRGWTAAINALLLFLAIPAYSLVRIDGMLETQTAQAASRGQILENIRAVFPGMLNGNYATIVYCVIFILAMLCALTGYGYVHSKEKLDFYHSLPIRRSQWFAFSCVSGILIFFVPYLICCGLAIAAAGAKGILTPELFISSLIAVLGGCLAYLIIYSTVILAMMLTGRLSSALPAAVLMVISPFFMLTVIGALETALFETFYPQAGGTLLTRLAEYLSPLGLFARLIETSGIYFQAGTPISSPLLCLAAAAVMTAILLTLSAWLYRRYPSEAAGSALAFPKTAAVLKAAACIPGAFIASYALVAFTGVSLKKWFFPFCVLTALILALFVEFIYRMDARQIQKGWKSSLFCIAGTALIASVMQFDLIGYDSYMPEEDKIAAISIRPDSFSSFFIYPAEYDAYSDNVLGFYVPEDTVDTVYKLAGTGLKNVESGISIPDLSGCYTDEETGSLYMPVLFRFKLENGHTVYRQYPLSQAELTPVILDLLEHEEYRREIYPVFQLNRSDVYSIDLADAYQTSERMTLTSEQRGQLLDAFEKDLLAEDASTLLNGQAIGRLDISIPDPYQPDTAPTADASAPVLPESEPNLIGISGFDIYPDYTNTIRFLEEHGYTIRRSINPEDVKSINLTLSLKSVQSAKYSELFSGLPEDALSVTQYESGADVYTSDPEAIRKILAELPAAEQKLLDISTGEEDFIDIQYINGDGAGYSLR